MTQPRKFNTVHKDHLVKLLEHPQALGSFRSWLKLLNGKGDIDPKYIPRILVVSIFSLLTSPLRMYERVRYNGSLQKLEIHPSPVIVLGHWRTGTTHLHNLLCQDNGFGYVTTYQAMAPGLSLVGDQIIKPILAWIVGNLYPTRMIDNIPLIMDMPQEEEYAVANLCPYSYLHMYSFPREAEWFFDRYITLNKISEEEKLELSRNYLEILRKASFKTGGARLVLKNPAHLGRLPFILDLFPSAKFIHLVRNPYDIYLSMEHFYRVVLPRAQLQDVDWELVDTNILKFYSRLMRRFLEQKDLIPKDNFVEVRFEDLEASPIETIHTIYRSLGLPDFEVAKQDMQTYADSIADYRKNQYVLTPEIIEKVNTHWDFAFDQWGYKQY